MFIQKGIIVGTAVKNSQDGFVHQ